MTTFKEILDLYEDFRLHRGKLHGEGGFFDYRTPASLHSDVTCFAYGIAETKSCLSLQKHPCESEIVLSKEDLSRRFYIKLQACLFRYTQYICPITIRVNGKIAYENPREFFETVNLGWPTVYIPVSNAFLRAISVAYTEAGMPRPWSASTRALLGPSVTMCGAASLRTPPESRQST